MNDMWRCNVDTCEWECLQQPANANVPAPAFGRGHTLLRDGRRWFFYGGIAAHDVHLNTCHVYDTWSNQWTLVPQLGLRPLWGHSVSSVLVTQSKVCLNGDGCGSEPSQREALVVIAGMEHDVCNDSIFYIHNVECEDVSKWAVEKRPYSGCSVTTGGLNHKNQFPLRRRHGACVYRNVFILVAGGRNQFSFLNDMWAYNTVVDTWVPLMSGVSPPLVRRFFSLPNSMEPADTIRGTIERVYGNATRLEFHHFSTMHPRTGLTMFIQGDLVYAFGGFFWSWSDSCSFADMHVYDITHHQWQGVAEVDDRSPPVRPRPTTMSAICPLPQLSQAVGGYPKPPAVLDTSFARPLSRWFLFGGRFGNFPTNRAYIIDIRAPSYRLTQVAFQWLRDAGCAHLRSDSDNFALKNLTMKIHEPPFAPSSIFASRWGRDSEAFHEEEAYVTVDSQVDVNSSNHDPDDDDDDDDDNAWSDDDDDDNAWSDDDDVDNAW
eukprot:CAMPEP_0176409832 /NCGR_PEP_ID=MMETSP0127-20121128/2715_1 /TAXON_ID=938130 /ORGANISM="Platyophrya macrostoma, Strain WH" /LENGTH=488 /DNA_ID=CAMNT_0017789251 /DNA_START=176 /DNA_END=1639 /DNA_ORIENTATION=-